jgi:hypothetical protein
MATNLILNPSFTQGTTNWTFTNCTTAGTTAQFLFNNIAREITANSAATAPTIDSAIVNIAASTTHTASLYVKLSADQPSTSFSFSLKTYQSDGTTLVNTFTADTKELTVSDSWYRFTVTGTSGGAAVKARISLTTTSIVNGRKFVIDGAQLVTGYTAVEFDYIETVDQAQENKIINKALSKVPFPHLSGVELNADVKLGDFTFNTIDANNVAYILTDIVGLYGQPETEYSDISRGFYADGDYDVRGRYQARQISLVGSILVQDKTSVASAREKLVRATELVKRGTWLKVYPPNATPHAIWVRLSGALEINVVNPRGRMDFSVGLRAADPLIYAWNEDREDGYYVANVAASNYEGTQTGEVSITNNGNYQAPAIFEVRGPINGSVATLFNYSNAQLTRIIEPVRGERYYLIGQKSLKDFEATLKFPTPHDLIPGDSITVSIPVTTSITDVTFVDSTDTATINVASTAGYSIGDLVSISGLPSPIDVFNGNQTIFSVTSTTQFTIKNTTLVGNISLTSGDSDSIVYNITNSRFDGEQVVSSIPDAKSVSFLTTYRETYSLRNLLGADVANSRCVVYKDADYLEIDSKDQNVALNGDGSQYRGKIDALSDWIRLEPGVNKILLDDAQQVPYYVERREITAAGVATLQLTEPHTFAVGDNINVVDVGAEYDTAGRAKITSYSRAGNVVTAFASGYGMTTGTSVVIGGVDFAIDGQYAITNVNASAFTFVTNSSGTIYSTNTNATVKKVVAVSQYSRTSNVATLTTTTAHGLSAGQAMYVVGVHPEFDGQWYVATAADNTTLTYDTDIKFTENFPTTNATTGATVYLRYPIISYTDYSVTYTTDGSATLEGSTQFGLLSSIDSQRFASINNVSRTNNIATLTTTKKHNYQVGEYVSVEGPSSLHPTYQVSTGNAKVISSWTLASNLVTVTSTAHGLVTNDKANIFGVRTGSFIDINGQFTVERTGADTFRYNIAGPIVLTYGVDKYSISNNIVRLELNAKPEFDLTYDNLNNGYPISTQIDFASSGTATAIVGRHDVIGRDTENNVIWFATTAADVTLTSLTNTTNTVAIVYDNTPERGRVQRVIEAVYYTINNDSAGTTEAANALSNTAVAGNTVWVRTNTAHSLSTGATVDISGLSSLFNGVQTVTSVDSTMFKFTIDNTTNVKHANATITRAGTTATVTFTEDHGYVVGDKVWIYSPRANVAVGVYEVLTSATAKEFQITTVASGAIASGDRAGYKVLPYREDAEVIRVYPILEDPAPTDFTFSYKNSGDAGSSAIVAADTAGEVVASSDASMKIYYRSASIG